MNIKVIPIILIVLFSLSTDRINAQPVFDIPKPTCVSTPEIPCPGDKIDYSKIQKPQTDTSKINENINQLFIDLQNSVNKLMKYLKNLNIRDNVENLYNNLHTIFDSWINPIFDKKTK